MGYGAVLNDSPVGYGMFKTYPVISEVQCTWKF